MPQPSTQTQRQPSSAARRAAKTCPTTYLLQFPPAVRPAHIIASTDRNRLRVSEFAARTLAPIVEAWPPPHHPYEARRRLTAWTFDLGVEIANSSRCTDTLIPALQEAWTLTLLEINRWTAGHWSTRSSLAEFLWRLEVSPHAITAADWLWTLGDAQEYSA